MLSEMASAYMFIYIVPSCLTCSYLSTHPMVFVPVPSAMCLHVHRCTHLTSYPFILMLYTSTYVPENKSVYINAFLLGYPSYHEDLLLDSTIPLLPVDAPVHDRACSFSYFYSDQPLRSTHKRSYCSTCPQIYPVISMPAQFNSSFPHNFMYSYL